MTGTICREIIKAGVLEIRDLSAGQVPFLYSSGNYGPGYVTVKSLVSRPELMNWLCHSLWTKVKWVTRWVTSMPDLVAGNATGGMIPGWLLSQYMKVPFIYVQKGRVVGMYPGLSGSCLVIEELVNFAQTIINSAEVLHGLGFTVTHAATILSYDNPVALENLKDAGLNLISLVTLDNLLNEAEKSGAFPVCAIDDYRTFLLNPLAWQKRRGLEPGP